ncbi:hypothetical protein MTO96_052012, partial [Rhipicephalus appendiculatus]
KGLVDNCNVWCPDGQDYVNIYYPNGTICKYDESHNGTCIEYAEGKTGCLKHEIGSDRNHGQISTKSKTKEDIGKALVLALAIVACIVAVLVTARRLGIRDQDANGGIERLVTNVTTLQHHIPSGSSGVGVSVDRGRIGAPAKGAERRAYGAREKSGETAHRSVASGPQSISKSTPDGDFSSYSAHPEPDTRTTPSAISRS